MKNKKQIIKFSALAVFLVLAFLSVRYFGVSEILRPAMIKEKILMFGMFAPFVFMLFYAGATVAFIPGTPLTIAAGALFGPIFGTLYTVVGATTGAALAFILTRTIGRGFVGDLEGEKWKKLSEYDKKMEENGLGVVLFLRFVPLFPFNGLNFALGLTKVKFKDYFLGTVIGILPGSFAYVYLGDSLASLSVWKIALAILLLSALSFAPSFFQKRKNSVK
jgi:uncharacterized membrane protein YdjX (TVP38/TMEM64 family)